MEIFIVGYGGMYRFLPYLEPNKCILCELFTPNIIKMVNLTLGLNSSGTMKFMGYEIYLKNGTCYAFYKYFVSHKNLILTVHF